METRDPTKARRYEGFKAGRQEERKAGKRQDHAAVAHYPRYVLVALGGLRVDRIFLR